MLIIQTKEGFYQTSKKLDLKVKFLNKSLKLTVSNAGVRSVDKESFDRFIKSAKAKSLSIRLKNKNLY